MSCETPTNGMIGSRLPVRDAQVKVTGQLKYVADMKMPHMLHAKVLFSPVAHARIKSIDTSEAEALPGVRAVVCYKNAPDIPFNCCGENIDESKNERIFDQVVRYVGDKVAAVAADTVQIAEKALKLIKVEYEELPFYIDPEEAMKEDAYPIHEGGNIAEVVNLNQGDVDAGMQEADLVFEDRYSLPAIHHSAIETHAALASYDANGKLTVWSPSQDAFAVRVNLSRLFGLKMSRVRVVASAIGGGFGGKIDMIVEHVAALLSIKTGRPVRLVYTRREDIPSSHSRHQMIVYLKTGVKKDGTVVAQDFNLVINAGAFAGGTSSVAWAMGGKAFRIMDTPNIRFKATEVYTNCTCGAAMRGFGSPQLFFAQQRQFNKIAKELGMDLTEFLLKNLKGEQGMDLRNNTPLGNTYAKACVEKGAEIFNWKKALEEQEASRKENGRYRIGVGMAVAAHGNGVFGVHPDTTGIILRMNEDGTVILSSGCCDMGNGSVSLQGQLVAEVLGIPMTDIEYIQADTDATLWDLGNYSSRGTYVSGAAAVKAANSLKKMLLEEAADVLPEDPDRIVFHDGRAWSLNYPDRSASMADLAHHAHHKNQRDLVVAETFASQAMAVSYGAHFVKTQVDTETGEVKVLDYVAVHDVGTPLNPMSVEGQIEGAIQMGLGYALSEGIDRDEKGKVKNGTFRTYHIFTSTEMPPIRIGFVDKPEETGPYGGKSIGECSVVPAPAAIANAVSNAVEGDYHDLPLRKEVVLAGLPQ
ncbi:molybdopterin cofactor-binding domain-containing protein [Clostridium sp. J1101437_171009_A5]|uniref:xanthine dehydrogenase family protein molybdopterin-binding subunit n=1 Tax=Clostridium sp. J1101437_171009_A5 TaxID=2787098 RepID=UPI001898213E|nr:molybdopterin cofactor-binding domain-containing protein [Clostridium sp. J1101437_171009_A5]